MKRKQVNKSKEMFQIIKDYSEYSSIQGLIYIFMSQQTGVGRLFWILIVILMLMLGTYWSSNAYDSWQNDPVLTTVKSTAFPVTHVRLCFIKLSNYEFNRVHFSINRQNLIVCKSNSKLSQYPTTPPNIFNFI